MARLAGAAGLAILTTGLFISQGGFRRRIDHVRQVVPGSVIARPHATVVARHADGEYHYGLLFRAPWRGRDSRIAWHSVLDTRFCDRGPVERWQCNTRSYDGTTIEVVVFLPRSWLILQGFLPLHAVAAVQRPHRLRSPETLLQSFWLEEYEVQSPHTVTDPG
jgi:hypothetical protein